MNFILHNPWGLLALCSLPIIIWLHHYVVRGTLKPVSCLALWQDPETLQNEGQVRDKLPWTGILLLELLAAVLLTLVIAGLDWQGGTKQQPHLGVVIDNSASMAGNEAYAQALQHLTELQTRQAELTVSVILSGQQPSLLGGQALPLADALAQLQHHRPHLPQHSLTSALELLALLVPNPENSVVFSDDATFQHPRKVAVGQPVTNIGIVAADWQAGQSPFVVVRNFGETPAQLTLSIRTDTQTSPQTLPLAQLAANSEQLLELTPTATADRITVTLPADALAVDNQVTLLAPTVRQLSLWVRHDNAAIQTAFRKLLNIMPILQASRQLPSDVIVLDRDVTVENSFVVAFPDYFTAPVQLYQDLVINAFHPLLEGFDGQGLVWYAHALPLELIPTDATMLLKSESTPLLWSTETQLVFNLDLARSNLLQHVSFPVLMQNLIQWRDTAKGGLLRRNYRVGETLQLQRAADWIGAMTLQSPTGHPQVFPALANPLAIARFAETGIYQLRSETATAEFAVNFLDAREGDLTQRLPASVELPALQLDRMTVSAQASGLQQLLILLTLLALLSVWLLLVFRRA